MFTRYKYETSVSHSKNVNSTESILPCMTNHSMAAADETIDLKTQTGMYTFKYKFPFCFESTFTGEEAEQCSKKTA